MCIECCLSRRAKQSLTISETYMSNKLPSVNVNRTKSILARNIISPSAYVVDVSGSNLRSGIDCNIKYSEDQHVTWINLFTDISSSHHRLSSCLFFIQLNCFRKVLNRCLYVKTFSMKYSRRKKFWDEKESFPRIPHLIQIKLFTCSNCSQCWSFLMVSRKRNILWIII